MSTRLEELGIPEEEAAVGRLEAGSPRGSVAWTPLQYACALGDTTLVSELLATQPESINTLGHTKHAYTALHLAVRFEHEAVVKLLLAATAPSVNVDATDAQVGATPLHLAVLQNNASIVRLLLDAPDAQQLASKSGTTPLELAEELEVADSIRALLVDHAARSSGRTQIREWLASIGLVQYATQFFGEGFDDAHFLLETGGLSDASLDAMQIHKVGHRAKLKTLYQLEDFLNDESEEDSADEEDSEVEDSEEEEEEDSDEELSSDAESS